MPASWAAALLALAPLAAGLRHLAPEACRPGPQNGTHFLVDNSQLRAGTRGLSFRHGKSSESKDATALALWGTEVVGTDEGDGWVKVGNCYLPMAISGAATLRPTQAGASELARRLAQKSEKLGQLTASLTEAAEVLEKVTAKLKRSDADAARLKKELEDTRVESRKKLEAAEAKNEALQRQGAQVTLARGNETLRGNESLEAENRRLSQELVQASREKAYFESAATKLKTQFDQKEMVLEKTVSLLDEVQAKWAEYRKQVEARSPAAPLGGARCALALLLLSALRQ